MKITNALIITLIFIPCAVTKAEEPAYFDKEAFMASANSGRTLELGIVDCVAMALQNNSEINVKRITPRIEDANVMIEKAVFEPDLSFDFTMEDDTSLSPNTLSGTSTSKTRTGKFDFGYDQTFVTGTEIALDFYNTRTRSNSRIQSMNPQFDSKAEITITQPLLKGFGILVNKADFLIAKNNKLKAMKDFEEEVINVLTDVKRSYYDLQYRQEEHRLAASSLARMRGLYEINKERYSKGLASDVDVLEAEAEFARADEALLAAEASLRLAEDNLKLVTNLVDNPEFWNAAIAVLEEIKYEKKDVDMAEAIKRTFSHRPDYEAAKIDLHNKDISIVYNKNGMLPTVDLVASYGLNGLDKVYEKDLAHVGGAKYDDWVIGVSVKVPLGSGEEKGKYEKSKLEKELALISFKRLEQKIILEVRDAVRKVEVNYRMAEAALKSKNAEERQYHAQEERFKAGLVSTHDIVDYEERLTRAEAAYAKGVTDYNISLIELARVQGATLEEEKITID